jgi:1,4-dihydroxy-2-naphthoyl-CoA hydrolase
VSAPEPTPAITSGGLPETIGIELLGAEGEIARGRLAVTERILQPYGIVHGGAYAALAETVTSAATHLHVAGKGKLALGQSNNTTFLRPATEGHINARAHTRHRGRTTWVWDVEMTDDQDRLCAFATVTIAVREPRP